MKTSYTPTEKIIILTGKLDAHRILLAELSDSIKALMERVDKLDDGNGIHKPPEDVVRKYMRLPVKLVGGGGK